MSRIAVFGGSFDPPHVSHALVASYVLGGGEVDELYIVPTWRHALDKSFKAPFEHRLRMCELAFAHLRRVSVLAI
ncbi:MAG: nicotinate (nicotinamide) nucleotide adenylyltransferase, partial [Myxococcales bacterium]|nr:nicotinate (nicotinamide) nucleotide adenylyltransferase [Myxococcales bacterium]